MRAPPMLLSLGLLLVFFLSVTAACGGAGGDGGFAGSVDPPSNVFLHVATADALDGDATFLTHPWLDGVPTARLAVTHVLNPGGGLFTVRNAHPIGVRYIGIWSRWEIFNEDGAPMEAGAAFFVRILEGPRTFLHTAIPENSGGNRTILSRAGIDGDATALLFVTQYAGAPDFPGYMLNPHEIGVYYSAGTWRVFNQDLAAMPLGASFFVAFEWVSPWAFTHVADAASLGGPRGERTYLNHHRLNGDPLAELQVTSNWNPPGFPGRYNNHPIGVLYDGVAGLWAIENVDGGVMPADAAFNVWVQ